MGNPAGETTGHPTFWRLTILMPFSSTFSAIFSSQRADIFLGTRSAAASAAARWHSLSARQLQKAAAAQKTAQLPSLTYPLIRILTNSRCPFPPCRHSGFGVVCASYGRQRISGSVCRFAGAAAVYAGFAASAPATPARAAPTDCSHRSSSSPRPRLDGFLNHPASDARHEHAF